MNDKIKTREDLCAFIMALPKGWQVTTCIDWSMPEIVGFCNTGDIQEIKRYLEIRIDGPSVVREINSTKVSAIRPLELPRCKGSNQ